LRSHRQRKFLPGCYLFIVSNPGHKLIPKGRDISTKNKEKAMVLNAEAIV